jgi:hypothetical protein
MIVVGARSLGLFKALDAPIASLLAMPGVCVCRLGYHMMNAPVRLREPVYNEFDGHATPFVGPDQEAGIVARTNGT